MRKLGNRHCINWICLNELEGTRKEFDRKEVWKGEKEREK